MNVRFKMRHVERWEHPVSLCKSTCSSSLSVSGVWTWPRVSVFTTVKIHLGWGGEGVVGGGDLSPERVWPTWLAIQTLRLWAAHQAQAQAWLRKVTKPPAEELCCTCTRRVMRSCLGVMRWNWDVEWYTTSTPLYTSTVHHQYTTVHWGESLHPTAFQCSSIVTHRAIILESWWIRK